jgi:glycosyltransferase involved in cell wall biosynthesis
MKKVEVYTSVGGAAFFEGMLREWDQGGWSPTRIYALDGAEYRTARGRLARLRLRWLMYGGYAIKCWHQARQRRSESPLRVVTTNPFFAPALVAWASRKRGATVNLLYDLYPEALVQAGVIGEHSPLVSLCAAVTRSALRQCEATVFLGERLRRYTEEKYGPARRAVVIPVGADGAPFRGDFRPAPDGGPVTIMYAGQMGRMHDIATLDDAMNYPMPEALRLVFHSSGARYSELRKSKSGVGNCHWGDALGEADWRQALLDAQVGLVSVAPGAERIVMPSKTYSAMVAGQAILAICPAASDLADLVRQHQCGWVVEPGDVAGLLRCWQEIASDRAELRRKQQRSFEAGHSCYDSEVLGKQWAALFRELADNSR